MMSIPSSLLYYAYMSSSGSRLSTALHIFAETLSILVYSSMMCRFLSLLKVHYGLFINTHNATCGSAAAMLQLVALAVVIECYCEYSACYR
eukprot:17938-Heterococcus_DN1.PRE.5